MENLVWVIIGILFALSLGINIVLMLIPNESANTLAAILLRKMGVLK